MKMMDEIDMRNMMIMDIEGMMIMRRTVNIENMRNMMIMDIEGMMIMRRIVNIDIINKYASSIVNI